MMKSQSTKVRSPREHFTAHTIYVALVALAGFWLALIAAAPLLAHTRRTLAALLIYRSFAVLCHQMPERSFSLFGLPLAVCARCLGIYAGAFAGLCGYPFVRSLTDTAFPHRRWLLFALVPATIDFLGGVFGLFVNTHASRALTGAIAGVSAAFYVLPGIMQIRHQFSRKD